MQTPRFVIRKVAVLGAGVMGAQIAAHLANANIPVVLFDLAAKEGDPNGIVKKAIEGLKKLEPAPLATKAKAEYIDVANYDQHLEQLRGCDLIIEAISERMDWKKALYEKVAPYINDTAIFATNTSGLSINSLSEACPASLRPRFCGVHFFNPPRYMHLVELIPGSITQPEILDQLEAFLVTSVGKGVVRAKDTPNFVANRVGIFSMLAAMHHTEAMGLGFDEVDAITGSLIGRAKSATYRTADVVGLDTMGHVIKTMQDTLQADPWHQYFATPSWLQKLLEAGALGQKTKKGVYQKIGKDIHVLDLKSGEYKKSAKVEVYPAVNAIMKNKDVAARFAKLRASEHPQAKFLWACYRDLFHYVAVHLKDIAHNARDLDLAIRWGFGWKEGPFEIWQSAGWKQVAEWINEDIAAGKTLANVPLPAWVTDGRDGVYTAEGAYSPLSGKQEKRSALPVYQRQHFPDPVLGESFDQGTTIFENDSVRFWNLGGDDIGILTFKSKMNAIGAGVLDGVHQAIDYAEKNLGGVVIWQTREPFSAGADLAGLQPEFMAGNWGAIEKIVARFQETSMRLKYAMVPTVAAVRGLALGGGCEFVMHSQRVVAALESYMGLVEVGVGLLPAGAGCKERALRAALQAQATGGDLFTFLRPAFESIAMGKVAKSALEAFELGILKQGDQVIFNAYELLHVAKEQAKAMAAAGNRPPQPNRAFPVAGKTGIATLKAALVNMREGGFISDYDMEIGGKIARVLCGGEVEAGSLVNEQWLLDLERAEFMSLLQNEKTHERIFHMLETGKPLRN